MATLTIDGVSKRYGTLEVLKDIRLELAGGELLVLLGPSGCGKSTLLNVISGLDPLTEGRIVIDGRVVNDVPPKDRDIAMVFQSYALYPNMTVAQNIAFNLEMKGLPKAEREAAVRRVAGQLQIEHLLHRKPAQLSGGQRQRVAMGRALVRNPRIFLFDEPLSNLDAALRVDVRNEIKRMHQRLGATIVYVTHDQTEAMALATRLAVMKDGAIQQDAAPCEVYARPANLFVARFLGTPAMNVIPAAFAEEDGRLGLLVRNRGADGWETAFVPLPPRFAPLIDRVGEEVLLGLRPESIRCGTAPEGPDSAWIESHVTALEPTGADTLTTIDFGPRGTVARLRPMEAPMEGTVAGFILDLATVSLFDPATEQRIEPGA